MPLEVTFLDLNVVCPVWTATATGKIVQPTYLDQCLIRPFWIPTPNPLVVDPLLPLPNGGKSDTLDKLDKLNLEIIDATLSDATDGKCVGGGPGVDGTSCAVDTDCVGPLSTCTAGACDAGTLKGHPCTAAANCPLGYGLSTCNSGVCDAGLQKGRTCSEDAECPLGPGECSYPVFGRAGIVR